MRNNLIRRLISQIDVNEEYLLHKNRPLAIERRKVLLILKQLNLPMEVGTFRVHYRDVCQRMTVRAISIKQKKEFEYDLFTIELLKKEPKFLLSKNG